MANILVAVTGDQVEAVFDETLKAELDSLGKVAWRGDLTLKDTDEAACAEAVRQARAEIVLTFWGSPKLTLQVTSANPQLKYLCHLGGTLRKIVDRRGITGFREGPDPPRRVVPSLRSGVLRGRRPPRDGHPRR